MSGATSWAIHTQGVPDEAALSNRSNASQTIICKDVLWLVGRLARLVNRRPETRAVLLTFLVIRSTIPAWTAAASY